MRFVSLASGSRGNSALVDTGHTRVLIDCGISAKHIAECLGVLGLGLDEIDAVVITHEHSDHIKGLKRLMRQFGIPVYGTKGTLRSLAGVLRDDYFDAEGRKLMESVTRGKVFSIGDICFLPFEIYHDAEEPCGYRMEISAGDETREIALLTDCGHVDGSIMDVTRGLDAMILETNHDLEMLIHGGYPDFLKRRILSPYGHLSNDAGGELLASIISPRLKAVLLGHLSRDNNTHEIALSSVRSELEREYQGDGMEIELSVAPQDRISRVIEL